MSLVRVGHVKHSCILSCHVDVRCLGTNLCSICSFNNPRKLYETSHL